MFPVWGPGQPPVEPVGDSRYCQLAAIRAQPEYRGGGGMLGEVGGE